MIRIDFSNASIQVEPTGDPSRLAILETLETPTALSRVEHHYDHGIVGPTYDVLVSEAQARDAGNRVSREYSILEDGLYIITSGMRSTTHSRTIQLEVRTVDGCVRWTVRPTSDRSAWIIGDEVAVSAGTALQFGVELRDVAALFKDEPPPLAELPREPTTAWARILKDDESGVG